MYRNYPTQSSAPLNRFIDEGQGLDVENAMERESSPGLLSGVGTADTTRLTKKMPRSNTGDKPGRPVPQRRMKQSVFEIASGSVDSNLAGRANGKEKYHFYGPKHEQHLLIDLPVLKKYIPHRQTRVLLVWFSGIFVFLPLLLFIIVLCQELGRTHHGHEIVTVVPKDRGGDYNSFPSLDNPPANLPPDSYDNGQKFIVSAPSKSKKKDDVQPGEVGEKLPNVELESDAANIVDDKADKAPQHHLRRTLNADRIYQ